MWRKLGGTLLVTSAVLVSPCCMPITVPLALVTLGGTGAGAWISTHQAMTAVVGTVYFVIALALGVGVVMRRHAFPTARGPLSTFQLFSPAATAGTTAPVNLGATCNPAGSCEGAESCSPPVRAHLTAARNTEMGSDRDATLR